MISIGVKEEKSLTIWSLTNFTVIESKSIKNAILACVIDKDPSKCSLSFVTISYHILSLWSMNTKLITEGFHIKHNDIEPNQSIGEVFIALEMTPLVLSIKSSIIIIGTNYGNVFLMNKELKEVIGKFQLALMPLTHIAIVNTFILVSTHGGQLIKYKCHFNNSDINEFELKNDNRELISVDSAINSISILNENEGICLCGNGDIVYYLFNTYNTSKAFRLISSNVDSMITSIAYDKNKSNVIALGNNSIDFYSKPGYERIKMVKYKDKGLKMSMLIIGPDDDSLFLLTLSSSRSYISVFSLKTMDYLSEISIPDQVIIKFLIANDNIIILTRKNKLFLVQNRLIGENASGYSYGEIVLPITLESPIKSMDFLNNILAITSNDGRTIVLSIAIINSIVKTTLYDDINLIQYQISQSGNTKLMALQKSILDFNVSGHSFYVIIQ